MTSEICVMNRHALVLAADSAATVSRWENGQKEERYFKGSNKIFQLSNVEPIGAMIYDSADLQRVPWEIIVKAFRAKLGKACFETAAEYALEFFKFIEADRSLFPEDYLNDLLIENIDQIMIRFLRMIEDDDRVKSAATEEAKAAARQEVLTEIRDVTIATDIVTPFTAAHVSGVRNQHNDRLLKEAATDISIFAPEGAIEAEQLVELSIQALFRRPEFFLSETGIVVAGYGAAEFFPVYKEYGCLGFLGSHLCFSEKSEMKITPRDAGFFKAFATTAMADTFTMGFGPDVFKTVKIHLRTVLHELAGKIELETGAKPSKLDEYVTAAIDDHTQKWTDDVYKKHAQPLRRVIGSLPLEEMASLAETLVMLESLKEKVTRPSESVSGPIDVAIITRHEGFVWGKRKHYFPAELNSRYFLKQKAEFDGYGEGSHAK